MDDFYFPLTEGKLEKAKEEKETEMEVELEEVGKLEMKEKRDVEFEIALAPGLEPPIFEVEVGCANHKATPPQTNS